MSQNAEKTFIVTRSDGILLARYRDKDWYLTTDLARACRLSEADAQAVLQSIIPASERFLWTLTPSGRKKVFHVEFSCNQLSCPPSAA